jgi:thioesterase domain-containing protein/acyl carrier protein
MRSETDHQETVVMAKPVTDSSRAQITVLADDTATRLAHIWQKFLGVESIGLDQNYFDLGGDSSLAVQMFAEIEKTFKVKLPLATLYEAPTIDELARFLRNQAPASGWSPLVAIQAAGSRPPLFCMHPHGGNVLIYRDLSRHLGADQPFYGLQCQGLDGTKPLLTQVVDMASLYVKEIRRVQPHGPYFVGGYCMGGAIAYEAAQQLQADGEPVALLALFDTLDCSKLQLPSFWENLYYNGERLLFHTTNLLSLDSAGKAKFCRDKTRTLRSRAVVYGNVLLGGLRNDSGASSSASRVLGKIWQANFNAYLYYVPKPYSGTITDFRPAKQYRMFNKPNAKWDRLALGGQEVVVLPVNPPAMLLDPFVKHLAAALRQSMDAAIRRCESSSSRQPVGGTWSHGGVD